MPESDCANCGEPCIHIEDEEYPLCDLCEEALMWKRLILDVARGIVKVPDGFIDTIGEEDPPID